jgi:hypothetical protein
MNLTPNSDAALQTQCTAGRFNPTFCGKVARIAAAVCVVEFSAIIALLMMWVPHNSACRAWHGPRGATEPIFVLMLPVGLLTLWTFVLAIVWNRFANLVLAQLRWEKRQRASTGWLAALYRFLQPFQVSYTPLLTVVFLSFTAFVAMPLAIIVLKCAP